jgi:hypothetical protein
VVAFPAVAGVSALRVTGAARVGAVALKTRTVLPAPACWVILALIRFGSTGLAITFARRYTVSWVHWFVFSSPATPLGARGPAD